MKFKKLLPILFTFILLTIIIGPAQAGISLTITEVNSIVNNQGETATYTVNIKSITTENENLQVSVIHHQDLQLNWTYTETILATGSTKNFGLNATYIGSGTGNLIFTVFGEAWPVAYSYSQAINLGLLETSSYTAYVYVPYTEPEPTPSSTPTLTPTPTPTTPPEGSSPKATPTATANPTATPSPTETSSPSPSPSPTTSATPLPQPAITGFPIEYIYALVGVAAMIIAIIAVVLLRKKK